MTTARSVHERPYDHNQGFKRFTEESGLPFCTHAEHEQQRAERIWSVDLSEQEATS